MTVGRRPSCIFTF